jgi:hypothetical protein
MSARRKVKRKKSKPVASAVSEPIRLGKQELQKINLGGQEYPLLPMGMFDVKESRFHVFENSDLLSEHDINQLEILMYHFPERAFYFFKEKEEAPNVFLDKARNENRILSETVEVRFYKHPKFLKDYVRILGAGNGWERRLVEQTPEYIRFTLKLSESAKRRLQIAETIVLQKASDSNPISFKPKIWGLELDGRKAWLWFRKKIYEMRDRRRGG